MSHAVYVYAITHVDLFFRVESQHCLRVVVSMRQIPSAAQWLSVLLTGGRSEDRTPLSGVGSQQ